MPEHSLAARLLVLPNVTPLELIKIGAEDRMCVESLYLQAVADEAA